MKPNTTTFLTVCLLLVAETTVSHTVTYAAFGRKQGNKHNLIDEANVAPAKQNKGKTLPTLEDDKSCKLPEEGWCQFTLKPKPDGSMHDNCDGWMKSCQCTCRQHQGYKLHEIKHLAPLFGDQPQGTHRLSKIASPKIREKMPWVERTVLGTTTVGKFPSVPWREIKGVLVRENSKKPTAQQQYRVGLVVVNIGPLPLFINYFIALARSR